MNAAVMATIHAKVAELPCTVKFDRPSWRGSCAQWESVKINAVLHVPEPNNVEDTLAILHELGHVATQDEHDLQWVFCNALCPEHLEWEARAWEWALDNYVGRIDRRVWRFVHLCLSSYDQVRQGERGPAFRRLLATAEIESGGEKYA